MDNNTSISSLLSYGFETFKKNWQLLIGSYVIAGVLMIILSAFTSSGNNDASMIGISNLLSTCLNTFVSIGLTMVMLKIVRNQKAEFEDLYKHYNKFFGVLFLNILLGVIILVGFILLIVPGVYLCLKYCFAGIVKIDKNVSIKEAFSMSAKLTEGIKWQLLGFFIVLALVNLLGVLCLGFGLLVTMPVSALAMTKYYTSLAKG